MKKKELQPFRVLQVIGIMNRGGAENMIMNLYRSIDKNKVQFDFVENKGGKAAFDDEIIALGGKIYYCPQYNGKNHLKYVDWWKKFWHEHIDDYTVIHGHIGSTAAIYLSIAKKYGKFTIAHSHSSGTDRSLKSFIYKMYSFPTRYIADYFFACSEIAGKDRFGKKVIKGKNYAILKNAIDTGKFKYSEEVRKKVRDEFLICDDEYLLGHVGRYTSEKNHNFLLHVFQKICNLVPNVKLLMVGDGPLHKEMIELAQGLGVSDSVIFTGVRSDVNQLMQAMDLFILPSIYEGLPVTMVEAQTAGLKCIISDAVPEESILVRSLVTVCSLNKTAEEWAKDILIQFPYKREDQTMAITECGYDIRSTAKWLEDFYIEMSK